MIIRMAEKKKLLRVTTVPISLNILLKGQLQYMNENGFEVYAVSADGEEVEELVEREGVSHEVIPFTRRITPLQDLWCIWKLVKLIRRLKPEIVHTHTPKAGLVGMIAARVCGVPHRLHTVAGIPLMEAKGLLKLLLILIERITYAFATRIYPNSEQLRQYIIAHIKSADQKIKVLANGSSNGIDLKHFATDHEEARNKAETLTKLWRLQQRVVFTFVGRVVRDKGVHEMIDAFSALKAENPAIKLLLVGPYEKERDPLRKATEKKIEQDPDIVALGFQKDVRPYLLMSDVLVLPSYREGFPNVLLQASAMGIPSIASDINGCNEIIKHRINGLLIPPKDTKELTAAMAALASSKVWRITYGEKAKEHVTSNYEQQFVWKAILEEYRGLLHNEAPEGVARTSEAL